MEYGILIAKLRARGDALSVALAQAIEHLHELREFLACEGYFRRAEGIDILVWEIARKADEMLLLR